MVNEFVTCKTYAGHEGENNASVITIDTELDDCAYTLELQAGSSKYVAVMTKTATGLKYVLANTVTYSGDVKAQIVCTFEDGTIKKSNTFIMHIEPSINASAAVPASEISDFTAALAEYEQRLQNANITARVEGETVIF